MSPQSSIPSQTWEERTQREVPEQEYVWGPQIDEGLVGVVMSMVISKGRYKEGEDMIQS